MAVTALTQKYNALHSHRFFASPVEFYESENCKLCHVSFD